MTRWQSLTSHRPLWHFNTIPYKHNYQRIIFAHLQSYLQLPFIIGLYVTPPPPRKKKKVMLLSIGLYFGNEGASVFPFVQSAEGTSWPPPDSHLIESWPWALMCHPGPPGKTTKALFYSAFHMTSGTQMSWVRKSNLEKGGEITGSFRTKKGKIV